MNNKSIYSSLVLGVFIFLGLAVLGYLLGQSAIRIKEYERTVKVKGLSEREYPADIVIWPIQFTEVNNELSTLYSSLEENTGIIKHFLEENNIEAAEMTVSPPAITDRLAQQYGGSRPPEFRYSAVQTVTVYSKKVEQVRQTINKLADLGKQGIIFTGDDYRTSTQYIFNRLNEIKPGMVEEATNKAREVAVKFAKDSNSKLGKIKRASQGQFSISARDKNNPHIKKIRVVSTVEYYLSD